MTTTKWWFALIFKHFWLWVGQQKQCAAQSKAAHDMKLNATIFRGCYNTGQLEALNCTSVLQHVAHESPGCETCLQGEQCSTYEDFAEHLIQKRRAHKESQISFCMHGNTLQQSALTPGLSICTEEAKQKGRSPPKHSRNLWVNENHGSTQS